MSNSRKEKFLTEYQVINNWRNTVINCSFIMTSIFLPLSVGIFSTYFLIENGEHYLKWVFFGASSLLLFFWRLYALHIDKQIRAVYPRICELEEKFSFKFTRKYLEPELWSENEIQKSKFHTHQQIRQRLEESSWKKYWSRGHDLLNGIAIIIILSEYFIFFRLSHIKWAFNLVKGIIT